MILLILDLSNLCPKGKNFEDADVKSWPGHGERFGKGWPRRKIPVLEEVSGQREFFAKCVQCMINGSVQSGVATCSEGCVIYFLKIIIFACRGSMATAVQPNSLGNTRKTFYKTFRTSCRPRLYIYVDHLIWDLGSMISAK